MKNKVRINPVPLVDMLRFKNMAKKREKVIEKAEAEEIKGEWDINRNAERLHPGRLELVIADIIEHPGSDAKTYVLKKKDSSPLPYFRAGEYLSLKLNIDGSLITRPYSISSSPKDALKGEYRITVKNTPSGFASPYLLSSWKIGDEIVSSSPIGDFYYNALRDEKNVVAIAGGSGITPFLSMAKAIKEKTEDFTLTILYGSRTKESILFYEELEELSSSDKRIKVVHVLSDEKASGFEEGFINAEIIKKYAPGNESYSIFFSGPGKMREYIENEIKTLNIRRKNFRYHSSPCESRNEDEKVYSVRVKTLEREYTITASSTEPLLVALERSGIKKDSRCRSGECSWCRSRLIEGKIYIPEGKDMRRKGDRDNNYIHPCVTYPESDVILEI